MNFFNFNFSWFVFLDGLCRFLILIIENLNLWLLTRLYGDLIDRFFLFWRFQRKVIVSLETIVEWIKVVLKFISLTHIIRLSDDKFWSKLLVDDQISSLRCDLWAYDVFLFRFDMDFPLPWVAGVVECGGG